MVQEENTVSQRQQNPTRNGRRIPYCAREFPEVQTKQNLQMKEHLVFQGILTWNSYNTKTRPCQDADFKDSLARHLGRRKNCSQEELSGWPHASHSENQSWTATEQCTQCSEQKKWPEPRIWHQAKCHSSRKEMGRHSLTGRNSGIKPPMNPPQKHRLLKKWHWERERERNK